MSALSKVELYFSITQGDDNTIFLDFIDENDSKVNLSSKFSDIIFTLYDKGQNQELQWSLGSGLSIQSINRLNITFDESESNGLDAKQDYPFIIKFELSSNSKKLTGVKGEIFVEGPLESASNSVTAEGIVFDDNGQTFKLKTNYLAEHLVDVVEDIEDERDSAINDINNKETIVLSNIDDKETDAVDTINNYIDDAENYALSTSSFVDVDGNTVTQGAKGFKEDTQALKDSLEWKGAWDDDNPYAKDNRVSYQGESFISLQDGNQGNTPVGDSNDSFWDILAEKGQDGADGDFSDVENVQDLGSISGNTEIDLDNGTIIQATLSGSVTLTFTGLPSANTVYNFTLVFSGAETITYPSGTEFAGGSAPSIIGPDYEIPCSIDSAGNLTVYGVIDRIS